MSKFLAESCDIAGDLVQLRRRLHREPEVGLQLPRTQEKVLEALSSLGLEVSTGRALTSISAVLRGRRHARSVLLRADMDGLPVTEATGLDFSSTLDGAMHACGHDLHTAMLVGAARLLAAHRDELDGDVVFMFQPGEEGWDGAGLMIDEGILDAAGARASSCFALHVMSSRLPHGTFASRPGTVMAASDTLRVVVRGSGGHGSTPHLARDPVVAAAEMVTALQSMITRRIDVFDPAVVTVGYFHAGTRRNVIPDTAEFEATVRTFSAPSRESVRAGTTSVCRGIAAAHGLDVVVAYEDEYPACINDAGCVEVARGLVERTFGDDRYRVMPSPCGWSDDFARVLAAVPGCYLVLGSPRSDDPARAEFNHSPRAIFDDGVLADGAALYASFAAHALAG